MVAYQHVLPGTGADAANRFAALMATGRDRIENDPNTRTRGRAGRGPPGRSLKHAGQGLDPPSAGRRPGRSSLSPENKKGPETAVFPGLLDGGGGSV